jgi:hypothetical protein
MSAEYYVDDFENYAKIFKEHALYAAEFMRILDDEIIGRGLPPVGRTKDLFRMFMDLTYQVDETYKKRNGINADEFRLTTYMSADEVYNHMRTAFKEEFDRYMGANDGTEQ